MRCARRKMAASASCLCTFPYRHDWPFASTKNLGVAQLPLMAARNKRRQPSRCKAFAQALPRTRSRQPNLGRRGHGFFRATRGSGTSPEGGTPPQQPPRQRPLPANRPVIVHHPVQPLSSELFRKSWLDRNFDFNELRHLPIPKLFRIERSDASAECSSRERIEEGTAHMAGLPWKH